MAWLYEKNEDNSCRYVLGTEGVRPLVCIGVNPSTAEPHCLDRTLESVQRISSRNGYDSWIMLNVYPQRATNPDDMHGVRDACIHNENLDYIKELFRKFPNADIWAAWGTLIEKREYLYGCLQDIYEIARQYHCRWVTFGNRSKKGHPHHPLYLNQNSEMQSFDVEIYMESQKRKQTRYNYEDLWGLADNIDVDFQSVTGQNGVHAGYEIKYIPTLKQIVERVYGCTDQGERRVTYRYIAIDIPSPTRDKILAYLNDTHADWRG